MRNLEEYAGLDGLSQICEDSTKKCIAALHSDMLHMKLFSKKEYTK